MARQKRLRKMTNPPRFKGFRPFGFYGQEGEPVILLYEEYEVIRLLDYEDLSQVEAAVIMEVSRPTLTRIYLSARKKVATAFTEARPLTIDGGRVFFDSDWYRCLFCNSTFNNPGKLIMPESCPVCGGNKIDHITENQVKAELPL
jgi:uncharacterized protein